MSRRFIYSLIFLCLVAINLAKILWRRLVVQIRYRIYKARLEVNGGV